MPWAQRQPGEYLGGVGQPEDDTGGTPGGTSGRTGGHQVGTGGDLGEVGSLYFGCLSL